MLNDTNEKLASIQSKIETINERLEAGRLYSISSCGSESISVFKRTRSLFRLAMEKQSFYAHFFKLLALFAIAVAHLVYMQSFLDAFSALEDWSFRFHVRYAQPPFTTSTTSPLTAVSDPEVLTLLINSTSFSATLPTTISGPMDPNRMRDLSAMNGLMDLLAQYKRNTWMSVAAMCIALCTSSFFLFILPITETCKKREMFMGFVDLLSFASIPVLLTTRIFIVEQLNARLSDGMLKAHRIVSAERLMNILQCTILPRERLPFCSDVVLGTIFPIILLKYLVILALLTLAYIALAYMIEWCIRHWFPHKNGKHSRCFGHSCCVCTSIPGGNMSKSAYARCPSMSSIRPVHHNRAYQPVPTVQGPSKPIINPAALTSAPLLGTLVRDEIPLVNESIPQEPRPTENA